MNYFAIAFISFCLSFGFLFAQPIQRISGIVHSGNNAPLSGVSVSIAELHRHASTNASGEFVFDQIPFGEYLIEFRLLGYRSELRHILVNGILSPLMINLVETPLLTPSVLITATPTPISASDAPMAVASVEGVELERRRGMSIMQTLEFLPGINGFSGGPLAVKPVIRGLTAQRVLVAQNGERLQSQSWDEPQSPEIDAFDVERIEIIRGPASVMYGSDALGGVVNVVRPDVFEHADKILSAIFTLNAFSNNPGAGGALSLFGGHGDWAYRLNASGRYAGDYSVPAGSINENIVLPAQTVFNSGAEELNGSISIGWKRDWGLLSLDVSHFGQKYYIHPEPGRKEVELNIHTGKMDTLPAAPSQEIYHESATLSANIPMNNARLEFKAGFQYNSRKEEGVAESEEDEKLKEQLGIKPEAKLDLMTMNLDAKAHFTDLGSVGAYFSHQQNQTLGQNAIIPNFTVNDYGCYIFNKFPQVYHNGWITVSDGVRYDHRSLNASANSQLNTPDTIRSFDIVTGQIGTLFKISDAFSASINVSSGWRAPVAAELFINGSDEGAVRYKVGNRVLTPEMSSGVDISLRFAKADVTAEITGFYQKIRNFIYLAPTGVRINNLDVYSYMQNNASLIGGEFFAQMQLTEWLVADVSADIVRGDNTAFNTPLPLMPAARLRFGLAYHAVELAGINRFFLSISPRYTFQQDRVGLFETETPSFFLLDAVVGGEISIGSQKVRMSIFGTNLTNKAYFDHLSRYKLFAFNPGIGFALRAAVPFGVVSE